MKDLMKLVAECKDELDAIGIPYRTVRNWIVNTRAQCRWGLCRFVSEGVCDIQISARLLKDDVPDISTKDTIIHELLHTVKGGHTHKGKWKAYAEQVNQAYPQYTIKRTTSYEEKGVQKTDRTPRHYDVKYEIRCTRCGGSIYRKKVSKVILRPEKFRCGKCNGKLEVIEI